MILPSSAASAGFVLTTLGFVSISSSFIAAYDCLVIVDLKVGRFSYADAGQMHLYLNYASEHWMKPGENPPVGLILCAEKGAAEAHYALDNLPNKVLAAEYQTVLPKEKLIAEELERSRRELEKRASVSAPSVK